MVFDHLILLSIDNRTSKTSSILGIPTQEISLGVTGLQLYNRSRHQSTLVIQEESTGELNNRLNSKNTNIVPSCIKERPTFGSQPESMIFGENPRGKSVRQVLN